MIPLVVGNNFQPYLEHLSWVLRWPTLIRMKKGILEFRIRFGECRGSIKRTKCVWRICDNFVTDFVTTLVHWISYGSTQIFLSGSKWVENQSLPESETQLQQFKILIILIFCLVAKGWTVKRYQICVKKSKPESTKMLNVHPETAARCTAKTLRKDLFWPLWPNLKILIF